MWALFHRKYFDTPEIHETRLRVAAELVDQIEGKHGKAQSEDGPSIVMKRETIVGRPPALETYAEAQATMMDKLIPGSRVDAQGEIAIGRSEGENAIRAVSREFVIPNPSGELRQLQVYFYVKQSFYVLAGTAPNDMRFEAARKEFQRVLSDIRIELA